MSARPGTSAGVGAAVVDVEAVPFPRLPNWLRPHAKTWPPAVSAYELCDEASTCTMSDGRPSTRVGTEGLAPVPEVPSPSWPTLLRPHAHTEPSERRISR